MSWNPALDPDCPIGDAVDAIDTVIVPRARDLGGFEVRRALPAPKRQMVGPFIFFDQMGPAEFVTGKGIDVRPHPHIGLATVTYLYKGKIHHRDSLGTDQWIEPGAVNWMVAGHGITHSERTDGEIRQKPHNLFGIQTWVALPKDAEDDPADFQHAPRDTLPLLEGEGKEVRLILGDAWGARAPVQTFSEMFYADAVLEAGARGVLACRPDDVEALAAAGFSPDGLPLVGALPGHPESRWCGGFTGHGMGFAVRLARLVVCEMMGEDAAYADLFAWERVAGPGSQVAGLDTVGPAT